MLDNFQEKSKDEVEIDSSEIRRLQSIERAWMRLTRIFEFNQRGYFRRASQILKQELDK